MGLFYGILLAIGLHSLFLYSSVRQTVYFYLFGHTLSLGLVIVSFDGLALQLFPAATGWHTWPLSWFVIQLTCFTLLFVRRFVDASLFYPPLDRILGRALRVLVGCSVLAAFWGARATLRVSILGLLITATGLAAIVFFHARRHRPARIYAAAWGLLLPAVAVAVGGSLGLFSDSFDFMGPLRVAAAAEVLLAAMALAAGLAETRRALTASEEKLSRAFQASPGAITISTMAEGRFLEVNDSFEKVSGFTREEAIGRTSGELGIWDADGREKLLAALDRYGKVEELPGYIIQKSGRKCPIRFSAAPIEAEGQPCMVAVVHDMTQLAEATEQREGLIRRLESQNAELERFAYTVSHDLKAPLITIGGFLGLLEEQALEGNADKIRHYATRIRSASQHMYQLLEELLDLSRIGRVVNPVEDVSLSELAAEAEVQLTEQLSRRNVELHTAADLPIVKGDRLRLLEVFQNLLENAIRFLGDQPQPRIEIGSRREGDDTVCYVRDNGIGIEPRHHDKIFGLFERLDAGIEGTGVGLALVKRILEFHGGKIWVESEGQGTGATFCFVLPADGPSTETSATCH